MKRINILGGGLGGLSAAYYLLSKSSNKIVNIYESTNRVGGWIKSKKLDNGVIFQQAARTIRPTGPAGLNTLELINELNILNKVVPITRSHPAARTRMIYAKGKLNILPNSLSDLTKTKSPFEKPLIFYLMKDLVARKEVNEDESIYNFINRRFGKEVADYLISPLICGICAGDAKEISVKFLMESLFKKEQKYGSISKGLIYDGIKGIFDKKKNKSHLEDLVNNEKWSIYTFSEGLNYLTESLENELVKKGCEINFRSTCREILFENKKIKIFFDGYYVESDHIVSSISAKNLAELIEEQHPTLSNLLRKIPMVTVGVVNLQYNKKLPIHDAFGFLVPPCEKLPILGVIYDSCCFSDPNNTVLTVMLGGKWFDKYFGQNITEEQLFDIAKKQLNSILKINDEPEHYEVNILKDCIPQYIVGHKENVSHIETYINANKLPLSICGFSYYGAGVNDVILASKNTVVNL